MKNDGLSHIDESGKASMVDVSPKEDTLRVAIAKGEIHLLEGTLNLVKKGLMKKGDVLAVARVAGIQAAKKTSELIPLCHLLLLHQVKVDFEIDHSLPGIKNYCRSKNKWKNRCGDGGINSRFSCCR